MPFGVDLERYRLEHGRENPDAFPIMHGGAAASLASEALIADWAWWDGANHLDELSGAGYVGVMRYIARYHDEKVISSAERDAILAHGWGLGLVFETTAARAGEGWGAGQDDAVYANDFADSIGWNAPVYYADDMDHEPDAVRPYFEGALSVGRRPAGIYGGFKVIEGLLDLPLYRWQTVAWSGGQFSNAANLYQRYGHPSGGPGYDYDENVRLNDDWGQVPRPGPPVDPDPLRIGNRFMGVLQ